MEGEILDLHILNPDKLLTSTNSNNQKVTIGQLLKKGYAYSSVIPIIVEIFTRTYNIVGYNLEDLLGSIKEIKMTEKFCKKLIDIAKFFNFHGRPIKKEDLSIVYLND